MIGTTTSSRARPGRAAHRLDPLLRPRSLALVGASARVGSFGHTLLRQALDGPYPGRLYAVNPGYSEIEGVPAYPTLAALPEAPEHAVLAVADARVEGALAAAIDAGARAVTLFGALHIDGDPGFKDRITAAARAAGLLVCGGNGMGFYDFADGVRICGYPTREGHRPGPVAVITHSGSVFAALADAEPRLDFALIVSAGQELVTTAADYLDFALEMPGVRVVGLFLETVRDPPAFVAALEKAAARDVAVVAIKVGKSAAGARMTATHSGAMTGADAAYDALFERHGVVRVATVDELAAALTMFAQPRRLGPGGLASLHDSGGERALMVDLAEARGIPFAAIGEATRARLAARLDPGLVAENPLDAWGTGHGFGAVWRECLAALAADPATAAVALVGDRGPAGRIWPDYRDYLAAAREAADKPVFLVSNLAGIGGDDLAVTLTREGSPVIDALGPFLTGLRAMMARRDFACRPPMAPPEAPAMAVARWRARLGAAGAFDEAQALAMLADFGVPVVAHALAEDGDGAVAAARRIGYPVALKTAAPGIAHKAEVGGVALALADDAALAAAYRAMAARLGPRVMVAAMVPEGVEMLLGMTRDPQFGPLVTMGAGGTLVEVMADVATALAPIDAAAASRLVARLAVHRVLVGGRGRPAADISGLADVVARFSALAAALGDGLAAVDVNPLIVGPGGCVAVDALVEPVR